MAVVRVNGFTGTVNFSASGFPSGVDNTFTQFSSTTGSTLVAWVPPGTSASSSVITVTGTSGSLSASTTLTFTVAAVPGFSLTPAAPTLTLAPNQGGTVGVSVSPVNGFTGTVTFSAAGFPKGVSYAFVPASSASGSTFVVFAPTGTAAGSYIITLTGVSGTTTASTTITLVIS